MARKLQNLRNIGIIAHIDAGKTTVTERMLFLSGAKNRVGKVDSGTTTTDDDQEEQERGITIYSACVTFDWKDIHVNLLDTPGHVDFTAEVERSLRVLDGAVVVFSAREGVEAQSETVWRQADRYNVPRVAFINKLDREGAGFERVFNEIKNRLGANPVAIQMPVGLGPNHVDDPFRAIVDLIKMRYVTYEDEGKKQIESPIPEDVLDEAEFARENLLETLYEYSDELAEAAMEGKEISNSMIRAAIRKATIERKIQPVVCGSALHGIGVQGVLDSVKHYLPSPLERPPVVGTNPRKPDLEESRKPDPKDPFCGLVFKILPAKTGDLYWIRIYSGSLKGNSRVYCPSKDKKENAAQLWQLHATKKERDGQIDEVSCGEIVGVIGPRFAVTGDTLCDQKAPILLEAIDFPETVIEMAIEPESTADRNKLGDVLELLKKQDPTFKADENEDTGQTLIAGMGELHLEVIKNKLLRDFNLNVKVHKPRVSYRETVDRKVEVWGECHRLVNGQQLFARLKLRMEPDVKVESGVAIRSQLPVDSMPMDMVQSVKDEIKARGEGGGCIGSFPLAKIRVTLVDAEANEESTPMAFSIAAGEAFEDALRKSGPTLLEPIMKLTVTTPEEYYGDFVGDLAQRRAQIVSTDTHLETTTIVADAPLAELFGYSSAMRSLSQGRAGSSMEPLEYAPAPPDVADGFAM
ncbi:MAG: elongation factor G [Mariniblastus sp.]|nr:elongation factor G [Mariniblastus sp.]